MQVHLRAKGFWRAELRLVCEWRCKRHPGLVWVSCASLNPLCGGGGSIPPTHNDSHEVHPGGDGSRAAFGQQLGRQSWSCAGPPLSSLQLLSFTTVSFTTFVLGLSY
eukprot:6391170-Pyramimonas_sp.AAC.1